MASIAEAPRPVTSPPPIVSEVLAEEVPSMRDMLSRSGRYEAVREFFDSRSETDRQYNGSRRDDDYELDMDLVDQI